MWTVVIVFGSESDAKQLHETKKIKRIFEAMGIEVVLAYASAHRNPDELKAWLLTMWAQGVRHFIAVAGMSAALSGFIASVLREASVTAVPMTSRPFGCVDALLASLQLPPGLPVATMTADDVGFNQAQLQVSQQIAAWDGEVMGKLHQYNQKNTKPPTFNLDWDEVFPAA